MDSKIHFSTFAWVFILAIMSSMIMSSVFVSGARSLASESEHKTGLTVTKTPTYDRKNPSPTTNLNQQALQEHPTGLGDFFGPVIRRGAPYLAPTIGRAGPAVNPYVPPSYHKNSETKSNELDNQKALNKPSTNAP